MENIDVLNLFQGIGTMVAGGWFLAIARVVLVIIGFLLIYLGWKGILEPMIMIPTSMIRMRAIPFHPCSFTICRYASESSFSPAMPARISPMHRRRAGDADSPKRTMPSSAVPTAPMPVQTA